MNLRRTRSRGVKPLTIWLAVAIGLPVLLSYLFSRPQAAAGATNKQDLSWPSINPVEVASGLDTPVHLTHAGDNSGRIFIVGQKGIIYVLENGASDPSQFLNIQERVLFGGEQGLLSVAFPPDYASKGYFYVYYTNKAGNNVVARFYLSANPDVADPDSEELVLLFNHPTYANHNGGQLAFGPDGYLYIGTGDGGGGGDPGGNAQNGSSLLGKILRIDVESNLQAYQIPADNPFVGRTGFRPEVWSLGLRNPWRFSFDRQTSDLYIGDVGQGNHEEIDFQPASSPGGENYGWNIMEGPACFNSSNCDRSGLILPVTSYQTHMGGTCAVTGGFVYRGPAFPSMQGVYFFADFCSGTIWGLQRSGDNWEQMELFETSFDISSFGEDQSGELYVMDQGGTVYAIQAVSMSHAIYFPFVAR